MKPSPISRGPSWSWGPLGLKSDLEKERNICLSSRHKGLPHLWVFVIRPTNPFLRWVWAQVGNPHTPNSSKNALSPLSIPLRGVHQRGFEPWGPLSLKNVGISHVMQMLGLPSTCVRQPQLTSTKPSYTQPENMASKSASQPSGQADTANTGKGIEQVSRCFKMSYHTLKPKSAKDQVCSWFFGRCLLCLNEGSSCFFSGLSERASVHRKFLY